MISMLTGLRIAVTSPSDFAWLRALDSVLPKSSVWTAHMPAAVGLFGVMLAYAIYMVRAGLVRRIQLDRVRLMDLFRGGQARLGAINRILSWILFLTLLSLLVTGSLMYLGYGGSIVDLHRLGTWAVLVFAVAHVSTHWAIGGMNQLGRMFRPTRLPPPMPPFDPFELRTSPERSAGDHAPQKPVREPSREPVREPSRAREPLRRETRAAPRRHSHRETSIQAHPLAVAAAVGFAGMTMMTIVNQTTMQPSLHIRKITRAEAPVVDGDLSDPIWRSARRVVVLTNQGANFDGTGESVVDIRAVHDGETAYFSFVWDDPTRSLKHLPLIKKPDGWYVLQGKYDIGDEHEYHEDKFAVLLTRSDVLLAGDRTFHAGRTPIADKPATLSGRGLHYTTNGGIVDVWQWKATGGGLLGWIDDGHFGPPAEPSQAETEGRKPYKGGFAADPGPAGYADNFEQRPPGGYQRSILPKRLPKDWASTWSAMGRVDIDPNVGESEGARWWMTEAESVPYGSRLDARFPINALIPGVIIAGEHAEDRADVRCAARWAAGRWTLEITRRLDTKSPYDVAIASDTFMRVAAFDRSQIRHTRHIRPIRLEVQ